MRPTSHRGCCLLLAAALLMSAGCLRSPAQKKQRYFDSGKAYFEKGKYPEAIIQFQNALQVDKNFAAGHYQLARCFIQQGLWADAYRELTRATELEPDNQQAQLELTKLLFAARRFADAKDHAKAILEKEPNQVVAQLIVANSDALLGNLPAALQEAQRAVEMDPNQSPPYLSLATFQEKNQQLPAAEQSLQKAVSLDPKSAPPHLAFGSFYQRRQRWAEAEAEFLAAAKSAPNDSISRTSLAALYVAWGKKDRAEQTLRETKTAKPNDPAWYRALADYYLSSHESEKAAAEFASLHLEHPTDFGVTKIYILLLLDKQQVDQAMNLTEELLKQNPKDTESLTLKGRGLNLQGKSPEAVPILEAAVRGNPESPAGHFQLGLAYSRTDNSSSAEKEWREAVRLRPGMLDAQGELANLALKKNDIELLEQSAAAWFKYAPSAPQGYLMRGVLRTQRGDLTGAEVDLLHVIGLAPENATAHTRLGHVRFLQKRFNEAQQQYEKALECDPSSEEALRQIASMLLAQKQLDKAVQRVQLQVTKAPDDGNYHFLLGQLLLSEHRTSEAMPEFAKTIELDKTNEVALLLLAQTQQESGRPDEAALTYERSMRELPKDARAYVAFGLLEEGRGKWQHSENLYHKALDLQPNEATAANNLSYLLIQHGGDSNYALSLAQIARRAMPESPNTADTLAWAYFKNGIYDSSIALLREAVKDAPKNPTYHYHLALAYQKSNQPALAKNSFRRALELAPNSPQAAEIRQTLDELAAN
jgi:tetratricopeptide (TPR) repeat protein